VNEKALCVDSVLVRKKVVEKKEEIAQKKVASARDRPDITEAVELFENFDLSPAMRPSMDSTTTTHFKNTWDRKRVKLSYEYF
jgi:hypothetical protein